MFNSLADRLQNVFKSLRGEVRLTPEAVEVALNEIRVALLEADVNFKVVKAFVNRVRDRAIDRSILDSLSPTQQVVGIVRDEMLGLFGPVSTGLSKSENRPQVVLMIGLQGSGKTTTSAKLGDWCKRDGRHPLLVSTDVRRAAAITQLNLLCESAGLRVHDPDGLLDPVQRATAAIDEARRLGFDTVIIDTAGRNHVDDELMGELEVIKNAVEPSELLYVADAMTGQDAIKSAGEFHRRVGITGLVLSKMDGDAKAGAAFSVVSVVGVPIRFSGTGERVEDLELFQPERLVSRILGMGDILTLVARAENAIEKKDAKHLAEKIRHQEFTLEDLRNQMDTVRKMGPIDQMIDMIPGFRGVSNTAGQADMNQRQLTRTAAIIDSMTIAERRTPSVINGSRRKRIACGSGTEVQDVNRLLKQFGQMRKMLKVMTGSNVKRRRAGGRRVGRMGLPVSIGRQTLR
jgi:signal recognition particle subunit SRP54